ncbi:MAG: hypothetical protein HYY84_00970 [Deltaproteobacteria bacterium]|nr:hypothetical protein [Deltaproteobacteria bacterium]
MSNVNACTKVFCAAAYLILIGCGGQDRGDQVTGTIPPGFPEIDSGTQLIDAGAPTASDGGRHPDVVVPPDAGAPSGRDGGTGSDAGQDAGARVDAGTDAGARPDAGQDGGTRPDAGTDAGVRIDAGADAGTSLQDGGSDAGSTQDAGTTTDAGNGIGTACSTYADCARDLCCAAGANRCARPDLAWTQLTSMPNTTRAGHVAIFRESTSEILVHGGFDGTTGRSDVMTYSAARGWNTLTTSGTAPARSYHTAVYDKQTDRMILFGGYSPALTNEIWALDLSQPTPTWSQLSPTGTPPAARQVHSAIFDSVNRRMIVYGGNTGGWGTGMSDVWALSLPIGGTPSWTQLPQSGVGPSGRAYHTAIYDAANQRMITYAGYSGTGYLNDVWELSLSIATPAWSRVSTSGATGWWRTGSTAVYDSAQQRMVVFAGSYGGPMQDVQALTLPASGTAIWSQLIAPLPVPGIRTTHAAVFDSTRVEMFIVGGFNGSAGLGDAWALSLVNYNCH